MTPLTEHSSPQISAEQPDVTTNKPHRHNHSDSVTDGFSYHIYGMRIRSEFQLLLAGCELQEHDVTISQGQVPDPPTAIADRRNWFHASPDGISFGIQDVGRFQIYGGNDVRVQRAAGAEDASIRPFLVGSSIGYLLHQQRRLPLHASCVEVNGGCVAFVGRRGEGKSTLAALLHDRGHSVLTDDICATQVFADRPPMVALGSPTLKLKPASLAAIGQDSQMLNRVAPHIDKFGYHPNQNSVSSVLALKAIYILRTGKSLKIHETTNVVALSRLKRFTYRRWVLPGICEAANHFEMCARLASQIPIRILDRPRDLARVDETLDLLERDFDSLPNPQTQRSAA